MAWQIEVLKNTIRVSKDCIEELWGYNKSIVALWSTKEEVSYKNFLYFDPDLGPYVDYLYDYPEIIEILKKYKVEGCIYFGSLEVPEGCFWGHEFDGKGGYKKLLGTINFVEVE